MSSKKSLRHSNGAGPASAPPARAPSRPAEPLLAAGRDSSGHHRRRSDRHRPGLPAQLLEGRRGGQVARHLQAEPDHAHLRRRRRDRHRRVRARKTHPAQVRGDSAAHPQGDPLRRGRALLRPRRHRPRPHRRRHLEEHHHGQPRGRLDANAAALEEPLPVAQADLRAEDHRVGRRPPDRALLHEAADHGDVRQPTSSSAPTPTASRPPRAPTSTSPRRT